MARFPVLWAAALALAASPVLVAATAVPASAQDENDNWSSSDMEAGGGLRDLVRGWVQDRGDRRDMLMDLIQERRDRRDELRDRLEERMGRRSELMDFLRDHPWMRERLRERLASRWDDEQEGGLRGRLRERLAERFGGGCYFFTRSLRSQDGSLLVVVRRRVCRD